MNRTRRVALVGAGISLWVGLKLAIAESALQEAHDQKARSAAGASCLERELTFLRIKKGEARGATLHALLLQNHEDVSCPTRDAWGRIYFFEESSGGIFAYSAGPDGETPTEDDVSSSFVHPRDCFGEGVTRVGLWLLCSLGAGLFSIAPLRSPYSRGWVSHFD